jgi:hypothetical protein
MTDDDPNDINQRLHYRLTHDSLVRIRYQVLLTHMIECLAVGALNATEANMVINGPRSVLRGAAITTKGVHNHNQAR